MKKIFITTVQIAVVVEDQQQACDKISSALSGLIMPFNDNDIILDWEYAEPKSFKDKGEYNASEYEDGQAFKNLYMDEV